MEEGKFCLFTDPHSAVAGLQQFLMFYANVTGISEAHFSYPSLHLKLSSCISNLYTICTFHTKAPFHAAPFFSTVRCICLSPSVNALFTILSKSSDIPSLISLYLPLVSSSPLFSLSVYPPNIILCAFIWNE